MLSLLLLSPLAAAQPHHARAIALPPESLYQLSEPRPVRVFWNQEPAGEACVEIAKGRGWKRLGCGLESGWTSKPLPADARLRVRWEQGSSESMSIEGALGPAELGRVTGPGLPGRRVSDLAPGEREAWVALLGGGLARVSTDHLEVQRFGLPEGLPGPQVNAVALDGEVTWVGTSHGLAKLRDDRVERVWSTRDGLPDDWIQALLPDGQGGVWVGSYRGLGHVTHSGGLRPTRLTPSSVFSLQWGAEQELEIAYEGLRSLDGELLLELPEGVQIWDRQPLGDRVLLASPDQGVLQVVPGEEGEGPEPSLDRGQLLYSGVSYALAPWGESGLLSAAGEEGLLGWGPEGPVRWGPERGLPAGGIYEVEPALPQKFWVGGDGGLALHWPEQETAVRWPLSPLPEGAPTLAVLAGKRWTLLASQDGISATGRLPSSLQPLTALPGPILALEQVGKGIWALGEDHAWQLAGGKLRRARLPAPTQHVARTGEELWVANALGIFRLTPGSDRFLPGPPTGEVIDLAAHGDQLWVLLEDELLCVQGGGVVLRMPLEETAYSLSAGPAGLLLLGEESVWQAELSQESLALWVEGTVEALHQEPSGRVLGVDISGRLLHLPSGVPVEGARACQQLGTVHDINRDQRGDLWLLGYRGACVLPGAGL